MAAVTIVGAFLVLTIRANAYIGPAFLMLPIFSSMFL